MVVGEVYELGLTKDPILKIVNLLKNKNFYLVETAVVWKTESRSL